LSFVRPIASDCIVQCGGVCIERNMSSMSWTNWQRTDRQHCRGSYYYSWWYATADEQPDL